jgi:hypothetical protein
MKMFLLAILLACPEACGRDEINVELRALEGYLGLFASAVDDPGGAGTGPAIRTEEIGGDLQVRLETLLDRRDLDREARKRALEIYAGLARATGRKAAAGGSDASRLQEVYGALIRRAESAGENTLPLELEMLSSPAIGLDARETYAAVARMAPRIRDRSRKFSRDEAVALAGVLCRALSEPGWPDLEGGEALTSTIDLLLGIEGADRTRIGDVLASKLSEWKGRILRAEEAREGELAREMGIIHLYRSLELAGRELDAPRRTAVLDGLVPLAAPVLAEGAVPGPTEGAIRAAEIGEVRIPVGSVPRLPPLSPGLSPEGGARYLLAPGKAYQVQVICTPTVPGPRPSFRVLARAGGNGAIVIPRLIPPGMVPITLAETGRVGFLADREPWSIRRFLLAFQRCGSTLAADRAAVARIYKHSALREIPLPERELSFGAIVNLLDDPSLKERLDGMFWIDAREEAGRAAAFGTAGSVLSGNSGLRDTALALPTVAEANRILRDGGWFDAVEPGLALFNATRLVPEPGEGRDRFRHVVRTVLRTAAP